MTEANAELRSLFAGETSKQATPSAVECCEEIRRCCGDGVAAVLFYGSCLRRDTDEGVLDFYALVDSYADVYDSRVLAWSNALLPPNVYYVEMAGSSGPLRMKYAVMTVDDFVAGASGKVLNAIIWGRFCQPSLLVWTRNDQVRARLVDACMECAITLIAHASALLCDLNRGAPRDPEALWQAGLASTYSTELRPETSKTIGSIYLSDPSRYDRVALASLEEIDRRDKLGVGNGARTAAKVRSRWQRRLPLMKLLYTARLVKSAVTFGDWLPYALWKLERHTGVRVELSERQRRHPLVFGWPVIFRLLRSKDLR